MADLRATRFTVASLDDEDAGEDGAKGEGAEGQEGEDGEGKTGLVIFVCLMVSWRGWVAVGESYFQPGKTSLW